MPFQLDGELSECVNQQLHFHSLQLNFFSDSRLKISFCERVVVFEDFER